MQSNRRAARRYGRTPELRHRTGSCYRLERVVMAQQRTRLTVVAPAYDEGEVLRYFHRERCRVLEGLESEYDWEVLYVDDGSGDGTLKLLRGWAAEDERVRYVSFSRNFGHQAAFTAGLENACGDVV